MKEQRFSRNVFYSLMKQLDYIYHNRKLSLTAFPHKTFEIKLVNTQFALESYTFGTLQP